MPKTSSDRTIIIADSAIAKLPNAPAASAERRRGEAPTVGGGRHLAATIRTTRVAISSINTRTR